MLDQVLTLIAATAGGLDEAAVAEAADALRRLGADVAPAVWLEPGKAADLVFGDMAADQADAVARRVLGDRPIDLVAQPLLGRQKRLLVSDMESTLIRNEMLDELAEFVGLRVEIAAITARAMNGELDFEAALGERVALLAGLPVTKLDEAASRITLMPGARELVATMRWHGAYTVLVSGGFRHFTEMVRARLGLDIEKANRLEVEDERLTGRVIPPILGREAKRQTMVAVASERQIPLSAALAVGDGANDIDMIEAAGLGVAFHAKPAVAARARHRIDHGDLTSLLFAQGYRRDQFAE